MIKEIRTMTIKTADNKREYVVSLGENIFDKVGRVNGFKSHKTSPNFKSLAEVDNWIYNNIN